MGNTIENAKPSLRRRVWDLLELTQDHSGSSKWDWLDIVLLVLIVTSVLAVILETVPSLTEAYGRFFRAFDIFTVVVFTIEYVIRVWACTEDSRYKGSPAGRLRYIFSFYGIVDALAVLPFYLAVALPLAFIDLRFLRALRLMRLARVFKIGRYSQAFDRLRNVFSSKKADLGVAVIGVLVVLVFTSSIMYHVENDAQPEAFSSIPAAMWWGISTLTTVGYGDIEPVTPLGKLIGGTIQLLGIAIFALPAGILAAGYEEESRQQRAGRKVCHTCGQPLPGQKSEDSRPEA
ncbi:MAG: ion transporter [Synechococcaceae cyanobacterium]|nr:ion transporter [Synechococcaceae cyanobacterium]